MASSASSLTANSLVFRLRHDDSRAWQELVDLYAPVIYHWCKQRSLNAADSADVMQEVFAAVARSIGSYQHSVEGTFRGWLFVITQNKIRDFARKRAKLIPGVGGTTAMMRLTQLKDFEPGTDTFESTSRLESTRLVRRALRLIEGDFQANTWSAFWQTTMEAKSTADVAKQLNMSANSVRQAKSRVLRRLREQLGDL